MILPQVKVQKDFWTSIIIFFRTHCITFNSPNGVEKNVLKTMLAILPFASWPRKALVTKQEKECKFLTIANLEFA